MDGLDAIRDDIAVATALLDRAQADLNENKHQFSEEFAWHVQAQIDRKRFELESRKLTVDMLSHF